MERGRAFADEVEALAAVWCDSVCTADTWTPDGPPGAAGGILAGYFVRSAAVSAFAKPSKVPETRLGQQYIANPVAAHEKIAADLAHMLRLPVPPALLWDRGTGRTDPGHPQWCVLSAVPFKPALTWAVVMRLPKAPARIVPALAKAASAMVAFDTWLDNRDRVNAGNLILHEDPRTNQLRCAYIDFAQSMSFGWMDGPAPDVVRVADRFPSVAPLDLAVLHETLRDIQALSELEIEQAVQRIPDAFINERRRKCVLEGLLRRRVGLKSAIENKHGKLS